ncbi:phosphotransferase family protein [Bacillus sp. FJAT-49736]|uniref:phosphotransferase family protein n=1 Tax=Bacillus sp. FJAT-49736 TaxID=2833582 RepID=UPI0020169505|nr:phosphotransferase family protein [Bacillus sp. FJAT-49736]
MEHILGHGWEITPAGGATGEAFFAKHQEQKLFLKRNSSPFLAVLSAEGIVPKLVWTKRMENGDVITAQAWLNGRELKPEEMSQERVAKLLKKIHDSTPLVSMLQRLGKASFEPGKMLLELESSIDHEIIQLPNASAAMRFLKSELNNVKNTEFVVCHSDINHNNWLLSDDDELYLIDWDGPVIADPALDIGMLLYLYIPRENWSQWLDQYGIDFTDNLLLRMKWHVIRQALIYIQWHKDKHRFHEMNNWIQFLQEVMKG